MHSFLLIGQSNMAGRGFLDEAPEINSDKIYTLINGRWQKMFRPINHDRRFSGTNLAESFAEKYAEKFGVDVGLICCADGGTCLEQWKQGELLFDNAVNNARLAARTSTIVGVLWHQGESDCSPENYVLYKPRFEAIMKALRQELELNDVPFLLGGLGSYLSDHENPVFKNYVYVNEALKDIAKNNEYTGYVSSDGLNGNPDNMHFSAKALYEFGIRYFDEFLKIRNPHRGFDENTVDSDTKRTEIELL